MPKLLNEKEIKERMKKIIKLRARIKPKTWAEVAYEIGIDKKTLYCFRSRYMKDTI